MLIPDGRMTRVSHSGTVSSLVRFSVHHGQY